MNRALTKRGFTLVELILVIGMIAIIGIATVGMLHDSHAIWKKTSKRSTLLQDSQAAMEQMLRILRQAKQINGASAPSEEAGYITFTNTSNVVEEFSRDSVDDELDYGEPGDLNVLAGALSSLAFTCYDVDGAAIADPVCGGNIRSVEISATYTDPDDSSISFTLSGRVFCATDPVTLVTRWDLNETSGFTAADIAGSNDGTLTNMNGDEWTGGVLGGALEFDGSNDYIDVGDVGDNIDVTKGTVSAWVELNSSSTTSNVFNAQVGSGNVISLAWKSDDSGFWMKYRAAGTTSDVLIPGGALIDEDDGVQHFVALTWDTCADEMKAFIDGAQYGGTQTGLGTWSGSIAGASIGYNVVQGAGYLSGMIDDVRVYNTALSPEEIAVLANILRYREFTEAKAASDTTSVTISTPGDTSEGDLLIAVVATDGDTSASLAPPGSEGWTEIDIGHYSSEVTLGAWWKNADASESATHEFTWSPDETAYGWMMRFTGHDSSDPINAWATNGATSATPTSAAVSPTVDYALIVRLGVFDDDDITEDSPGLSGHTAITMDGTISANPKMYWYDGNVFKIQRANLDGSNIEDLVTTGVLKTKSFTLDSAGGKMYWFDENVDKIQRADLDGSNIEDIITSGVTKTKAMAVDSTGSKIYWADQDVDKIQRADFDGSNIEDLVTAATMKTTALAVDSAGGKMYWFDEEVDKIQRANLDGSSIEELVTSGVTKTTGLALDVASGKMYWADQNVDKIQRANLDGSSSEDIISFGTMKIIGLSLDIGVGGSGDPVSGGAGWLSQSSSGSSGTSTFSLTASQEARLLTIAITPDPDGGCYK